MNVYDFDKTIYDGDSSIDFYLFCVKRHKKIIMLLPKQVLYFFLYKMKIKTKVEFKECFFSFLKYLNNVLEDVNIFWQINIKKIKKWYLNQWESTDVIISASPEFLLKPLEDLLKISVVATKVEARTGKFLSNNCYGEEKVKRFYEKYLDKEIESFYTDSLSDLPMLKISQKGFLVKKESITTFNKE